MKQAFLMSVLPSKTGLVRIVNGRVLIRSLESTVTFTANLLRLLAIATDRCRDVFISKSICYDIFSIAGDRPRRTLFHSHSIVAGGLPEMSYTTRLMPRISLMIRLDTLDSRLWGSSAQWAVMKSWVCTARKATTYS